jgi:hypothetical protein
VGFLYNKKWKRIIGCSKTGEKRIELAIFITGIVDVIGVHFMK